MADNKKAKDEKKADEDLKAEKKPAEGEGGDAPEGTEGGEAKPSKFGKKKILIIAALALVVLGGAGAGAYFMGYLDPLLGIEKKPDCASVKEGDKDYEACSEEAAKEEAGALPGDFVDIPDLIVNLNSTSKQPHFLKISIKVELDSKEMEKPFNEVLPRVIDQFQAYLRELRMEDLRGSSGIYRMKIELLNRVRAAAPDVKVRDVLFQEILVQ